MDNVTYTMQVKVKPSDVDMYQQLTFKDLFTYLENAAEEHTKVLNLGRDYLLEQGMVWVLARVEVDMKRLPGYDELISITTWPGVTKKFLYPRYFTIYDKNMEEIGKIATVWTLFDIHSRNVVSDLDNIIPVKEEDLYKQYPMPRKINVVPYNYEISYRPSYSDFDCNKHLNNARYMELVYNLLGFSFFEKNFITNMVVKYVHEIRDNNEYKIKYSFIDGKVYIFIMKEEVTYFACEVTYKERI